MSTLERIITFLFGPEGESMSEAEQRELNEAARAHDPAPGLSARERWNLNAPVSDPNQSGNDL